MQLFLTATNEAEQANGISLLKKAALEHHNVFAVNFLTIYYSCHPRSFNQQGNDLWQFNFIEQTVYAELATSIRLNFENNSATSSYYDTHKRTDLALLERITNNFLHPLMQTH